MNSPISSMSSSGPQRRRGRRPPLRAAAPTGPGCPGRSWRGGSARAPSTSGAGATACASTWSTCSRCRSWPPSSASTICCRGRARAGVRRPASTALAQRFIDEVRFTGLSPASVSATLDCGTGVLRPAATGMGEMETTQQRKRARRGHQGGPQPRVVAIEVRPAPDAEARCNTPGRDATCGTGDASRMLPLTDPPPQGGGSVCIRRRQPCREPEHHNSPRTAAPPSRRASPTRARPRTTRPPSASNWATWRPTARSAATRSPPATRRSAAAGRRNAPSSSACSKTPGRGASTPSSAGSPTASAAACTPSPPSWRSSRRTASALRRCWTQST